MKPIIFRTLKIVALTILLAALGWSSYSAVHYFRTSSRFDVKQFTVSGVRHVTEAQVVERADFGIGANVFSVSLDGIRDRVEQLQWVREALVQRVLPDKIVIKVIEREPIGLARIRGEIYEIGRASCRERVYVLV